MDPFVLILIFKDILFRFEKELNCSFTRVRFKDKYCKVMFYKVDSVFT